MSRAKSIISSEVEKLEADIEKLREALHESQGRTYEARKDAENYKRDARERGLTLSAIRAMAHSVGIRGDRTTSELVSDMADALKAAQKHASWAAVKDLKDITHELGLITSSNPLPGTMKAAIIELIHHKDERISQAETLAAQRMDVINGVWTVLRETGYPKREGHLLDMVRDAIMKARASAVSYVIDQTWKELAAAGYAFKLGDMALDKAVDYAIDQEREAHLASLQKITDSIGIDRPKGTNFATWVDAIVAWHKLARKQIEQNRDLAGEKLRRSLSKIGSALKMSGRVIVPGEERQLLNEILDWIRENDLTPKSINVRISGSLSGKIADPIEMRIHDLETVIGHTNKRLDRIDAQLAGDTHKILRR